MEKLIIDRTKWVNGSNYTEKGDSQLLNEKGNMCCLGFECLRRGLSKKDILDIGEPDCINNGKPLTPRKDSIIRSFDSQFVGQAININDETRTDLMSDEERESRIHDMFYQIGVEVKFTN